MIIYNQVKNPHIILIYHLISYISKMYNAIIVHMTIRNVLIDNKIERSFYVNLLLL